MLQIHSRRCVIAEIFQSSWSKTVKITLLTIRGCQNELSFLGSMTPRGICSIKVTIMFLSTQPQSIWELRERTNSKLRVLNSPLKPANARQTFPNPCSCTASDLNIVGDVFSEGHVEHDQRFPRHGRVGEGVTTAIWPHPALQVSPVPYGMHGLIPNRRLLVSLSCFSLMAVTLGNPSAPAHVRCGRT